MVSRCATSSNVRGGTDGPTVGDDATVKPPPSFDPYELLGVDPSADEVTIDRAFKARIRLVHPDIAGEAGLIETKRLNVAREWLLDPELRARLPKRPPRWSTFARRAATRSGPAADEWE